MQRFESSKGHGGNEGQEGGDSGYLHKTGKFGSWHTQTESFPGHGTSPYTT